MSRQVDDADGSSALTIPREKLEDVLRDAQERIDIAEARCEQLTVQVLLLQSTDGRGRARARDVPFPRRNSGDQRDKGGRGAQFEAVYDEDCLPVSELEWRDEDDVSRPFSSQSIKYKGQGHGGNRDSHVSNESGVFPSGEYPVKRLCWEGAGGKEAKGVGRAPCSGVRRVSRINASGTDAPARAHSHLHNRARALAHSQYATKPNFPCVRLYTSCRHPP